MDEEHANGLFGCVQEPVPNTAVQVSGLAGGLPSAESASKWRNGLLPMSSYSGVGDLDGFSLASSGHCSHVGIGE